MQVPPETTRRQRRRWPIWKTLSWSVFAFLMLGVGWVVQLEWRLQERRELLADIRERGGLVSFVGDMKWPHRPSLLSPYQRPGRFAWMAHFEPDPPEGRNIFADVWGPNWLRRSVPLAALGCRWSDLDEIEVVSLFGAGSRDVTRTTPFGDDEAAALRTCPHLKKLWLVRAEIGDQGLQTVGKLRDLKELHLNLKTISPKSLSSLSELTALEELTLLGTNHEGAGISLSGLSKLTALNRLSLLRLKIDVTESSLSGLSRLTALEVLNLSETNINDRGLASFLLLQRLHTLSLTKTQITDAGLEVVHHLPNLQLLDLRGTKVTDVGVARLRAHPSLLQVSLSGTAVSDEMRRQLAAELIKRNSPR